MNKNQLTDDQLRQIMPNVPKSKRAEYRPFINAAMLEFNITTELRAAAFLSQLAHESGELRYMEEIASGSDYEGRADLGNTKPGDGRRYKGRGPIQLTGRANYRKYGKLLGVDLEKNPTQASTPELGFRIAGQYWELNGLNELADRRQFKAITKRINGGYNGMADRLKYYDRALRVLPDGFSLDGNKPPPDEDHPDITETAGTLPPAPAAEVKASEVSWKARLGSLSIPAGAVSVITAIVGFVKTIPPYAWFALAGIMIAAMVIGYLVWKNNKSEAHERTKIVLGAAADPEKNNLRLV